MELGGMRQRVLQLIYDPFYGSGGTWPVLGDLQRALNRQGDSNVDATRIVQRIPAERARAQPGELNHE
jgi:hypothetical protein